MLCLEALNIPVGFQTGHDDVEKPQAHEKNCSGKLVLHGASQLSADFLVAPHQQDYTWKESTAAEHGYWKGQSANLYSEFGASEKVYNGSDRPGDANSQKHIDSVTPCYVTDRWISVLVLDGCYLTRKCV